jgi:EAL domain-containing protein (putative c-di-GMP-specific phosphodiesterase class I)
MQVSRERAGLLEPVDFESDRNMGNSPLDDTASRLIDALNQDRFVLHEQPIRPLSTGAREQSYQEIFVRFQEEEEKLLPPGTFIPVLESCRLMHLLDRWVINRVIKWIHAGRRRDTKWSAPCCSINLSNDSLTNPDTAHFVLQQSQKGSVSGRKLAFEVAEEDANEHADALAALVRELRPIGCRFTVTSYNGDLIPLDRLQALGVGTVKLDVDMVTSLHSNAESVRRARQIQASCESRGIETIAEFVERQDTLEHLIGLGVRYAQGYGIGHSKPLYDRVPEAAAAMKHVVG